MILAGRVVHRQWSTRRYPLRVDTRVGYHTGNVLILSYTRRQPPVQTDSVMPPQAMRRVVKARTFMFERASDPALTT